MELHIGSIAIRGGEQTSLQFLDLDDENVQIKLAQGHLQVRLRYLHENSVNEIDAPNLAVVMLAEGDYRVDVDAGNNVSTVTVLTGAATVYGAHGESVSMSANQQMRFADDQLTELGDVGFPTYDRFDQWVSERNQRDDRHDSIRHVSAEMTGTDELDDYGNWQQDANFGLVWVPAHVTGDWVPYQQGHWIWVAPWGWTWVDAEPWGFAPSHYGRWVYLNDAWAWVPGPPSATAVYAPAVVAFVGGGAGGLQTADHRPGVAWFPLGPGEAYRPAYHASRQYLAGVNGSQAIAGKPAADDSYANQRIAHAITSMPTAAFVAGQTAHLAGAVPFGANLTRAAVSGAPPGVVPQAQSALGAPPRTGFLPPLTGVAVVALHQPPPLAAAVGVAGHGHAGSSQTAVRVVLHEAVRALLVSPTSNAPAPSSVEDKGGDSASKVWTLRHAAHHESGDGASVVLSPQQDQLRTRNGDAVPPTKRNGRYELAP